MASWHSMTLEEVARELKTNPQQGLSAEEAESRLKNYGYNEIEVSGTEGKPRKGWSLRGIVFILLSFVVVLSILMEVLFGISIPPYLPKSQEAMVSTASNEPTADFNAADSRDRLPPGKSSMTP